MVDTAFVGHISAAALGALGVNTALFSFSFLIFNFLGTATTPMIARAAAKGDKKLAGSLAWQVSGARGRWREDMPGEVALPAHPAPRRPSVRRAWASRRASAW